MNRVIWKFQLKPGACTVEMPVGARVFATRFQTSEFGIGAMVWALCDPYAPLASRRMLVVVTGEAFTYEDKYELHPIGSIEVPGGVMLHVFEVTEK